MHCFSSLFILLDEPIERLQIASRVILTQKVTFIYQNSTVSVTVNNYPVFNQVRVKYFLFSLLFQFVSLLTCRHFFLQSPRGLVVYVTKVEVEQHGGVTVVGDDAKVHHHYSPQS